MSVVKRTGLVLIRGEDEQAHCLLLTVPDAGFSAWWDNWTDVKIFGVILSALLLSLGAPFWYNTLKTLLGLREKIAAKDDAQRATRQTSQANSGTGPTTFAT